jgi:hypothetical protein
MVAVGVIRPFLSHARGPDWLSLAALPVALLHLLLEGYRWQMIPVYGLVVVLSVGAIGRLRSNNSSTRKRGWQTVGVLVGLLILAIAAALPYLMPVPQPLPPTGPYAIGTFTLYRVDNGRREIYSETATLPISRREHPSRTCDPEHPPNGHA